MWEYKVVTGTFSVDGVNVFIENPAGKGTLQQALDHYGSERWELVSTHLDGVLREAVLVLKRLRAGVAPMQPMPGMSAIAPVAYAAPMAAVASSGPPPKTFVDPDGEVVRRRAPGSPPTAPRSAPAMPTPTPIPAPSAAPPSGGRRRSKAELDRLARDD